MTDTTSDTTSEAAAVVRTAIIRTPPAERVRQALELSEMMRDLSLSRLRLQFPGLETLQLVELLLGETLIPRVRDEPSAGTTSPDGTAGSR